MKIALALVLLFVLGGTVTLWKAVRHDATVDATYPPLGQFVDVETPSGSTARLHYVQAGTGPDVILIHGAGGNLRDFTFDLVDRLNDRYRVTVIDRPGLGHSDPGAERGLTIAQQADLLAGAAVQLGLDTPILVGHSYGSAVALAWATATGDTPATALRPAALVLLGGVTNPWEGPPDALYRGLAHPVWGPPLATALAAWVPEGYVQSRIDSVFAPQPSPEGYGAYIGAGLTLRRAVLLENALQRVALRDQVAEMVPHYAGLTLPIEILHGDADATVPLAVHGVTLSQQAPGAILTVMEGVGHAPHHSDPEAVVAGIDRAATRAGLR